MGWGDDSVGKVLAGQAWGPDLEPQCPRKVLRTAAQASNSSAVFGGGNRSYSGSLITQPISMLQVLLKALPPNCKVVTTEEDT